MFYSLFCISFVNAVVFVEHVITFSYGIPFPVYILCFLLYSYIFLMYNIMCVCMHMHAGAPAPSKRCFVGNRGCTAPCSFVALSFSFAPRHHRWEGGLHQSNFPHSG